MTFDLYAWKASADLDADAAEALLRDWQHAGGDPARSPFEPSTDVGWFHRELMKDVPGLDVTSDAVPNPSTRPVWLATDDEPPARVVVIHVTPETPGEALDDVYGLATKYDLVLFVPGSGRLHRPLEAMSAYASATFWPRGAIRTVVAIVVGIAVAVGAWVAGVPLLSGAIAVFAAFMVAIFVVTLVAESRQALRSRDRVDGS